MTLFTASRYTRDVLVISQLALALALVTCAGLMIRSFLSLQSMHLGSDTWRLLTLRVTLPDATYDAERRILGLEEEVVLLESCKKLFGFQLQAFVEFTLET